MKIRNALVVDDEVEICFLLSNMLRGTGTQCVSAHSVREGRAALEGPEQYDAVFLDVHLPDGEGYDLIPFIRNTQPSARCIAISALDGERTNAQAAGADLFIPKPFDRARILSSIRSLGFEG